MDEVMSFSGRSDVAGVDEAGRGPLAGPVVAAAVILDKKRPIIGLMDSKKLSEKRRLSLFDEIVSKAQSWSIAEATVAEIDSINILQATMLAMQRAVEGLSQRPDHVLVDGNRCPDVDVPSTAVIKGDQKIEAISAASILAKVSRDQQLLNYAKQFPEYGFAQHKGYGTKLHLDALRRYGPCPIHRTSFSPVRATMGMRSATDEIMCESV